MIRKIVYLMTLALCISPLLAHNASGGFTSISLTGFYGKCYNADWGISGGQKPGSCNIEGNFDIKNSSLACINPDDKDVRVGQGGLTNVFSVITPDTEIIDKNGKSTVIQTFPWSVTEFGLPEFSELCNYWDDDPTDDSCNAQEAFENFYNVDNTYCVNPNWTPFAYLIRDLIVDGDIICDGEITRSSAQAYCVTDQEFNTWPIDPAGAVPYNCNLNPEANNDSYSFSISKTDTLTVTAPGVLGNDTDNENDVLTAVLKQGVEHGDLVLNPDGSFTYIPTAGFTGTDGFRYTANDANLPSADAWVTITVKK